jgi:hypothetical protein
MAIIARIIWYLFLLAVAAALLAGASWMAAYYTVGDLLGAPPPEMGDQSTTFAWQGLSKVRGHPRAWRFAFGPTRIPGAPTVRIYVSPTGHLLATEPENLPDLLRDFRKKGY